MKDIKDIRTEHCAFAELNSVGRCVANCYMQSNGEDCLGRKKAEDDSEAGKEAKLMGRRIE